LLPRLRSVERDFDLRGQLEQLGGHRPRRQRAHFVGLVGVDLRDEPVHVVGAGPQGDEHLLLTLGAVGGQNADFTVNGTGNTTLTTTTLGISMGGGNAGNKANQPPATASPSAPPPNLANN